MEYLQPLADGWKHHTLCTIMCNVKLRHAWEWITEVGKAGWIITSVVLIVACVALWFNIASYRIQSRTDRASIHTMQLNLSAPAAEDTYWSQYIQNSGREDATGVKLKLGTIDANMKNTKRLGEDQWVRLGIGASGSSAFLIHKKDYLDFFVTCLSYNDDRDQSFEEVSFYKLPDVPVPNMSSAPILSEEPNTTDSR